WEHSVLTGSSPIINGNVKLTIPINKQGYYKVFIKIFKDNILIKEKETRAAILSKFDFSQVDAQTSPFSIQTHLAWTGKGWVAEDILPLINKMGAKSIRDAIVWEEVETSPGVYNFGIDRNKYPKSINLAKKNGLDVLISFGSVNKLYDQNSTPYDDEGRTAMAAYATATTKKFALQITNFGGYNEFSGGFGDRGKGPADSKPSYYLPLQQKIYTAVKAVNPILMINGGETAGKGDIAWLEELFKINNAEALNYMDRLSVHPYRNELSVETLNDYVPKLNTMVSKYNNGKTKPLWFTEIGRWVGYTPTARTTEIKQASELVKTYVLALANGVERINWYEFMNSGTSRESVQHNFGVTFTKNDVLGSNVPKPAYVSYAVMTRNLTGFKFFKRITEVNEDTYHYVFSKTNNQIQVLWAAKGNPTISLKTQNPILIKDLFGDVEEIKPIAGIIKLKLSYYPVYILAKDI
ncbi:MAG: hypothetical protein EOO47_22225, partial [Flavobacterium sp.]